MSRRSPSPARARRAPVRPAAVESTDLKFEYPATYSETEPFSKPHTVTMLLVLVSFLIYAVWQLPISIDEKTHYRMGVFAALGIGLIFCAEHLRDTLFLRPHPAVWRFVTGIGLFYTMFLAFLFFLPLHAVRTQVMPFLDPLVKGVPLPHRDYAEHCELTWENIQATLYDEFVIAHLVGWIFKHWMIRDVGISMTLSLLFELMEYTFEFIQPNFKECWWDHWVLDFIICNTGGIIIGEIVLHYLEGKSYNWGGLSSYPTVGSKLWRVVQQFTPYNYTHYEWHMFEDFKRFCYVFALCAGVMVVELDAFLMKDIFWIQPLSKLNVYRLVIWWAVGMVGLRDYYAFMTNPRIKRLGSTAWIMLAMMLMEALVVLKSFTGLSKIEAVPATVIYAWTVAGILFVAFVVYRFAVQPRNSSNGNNYTGAVVMTGHSQRGRTEKMD